MLRACILSVVLLCAGITARAEAPCVALAWNTDSEFLSRVAPLAENLLASSGPGRLVERKHVRLILNEHRQALAGLSAGESSLRLGALLSADIMVVCEDEKAMDARTQRLGPAGLRLCMYEVASSLKLLDATIPLPLDDRDPLAFARTIVNALSSGWAKYPASRKGVRTVAVAETRCGSWNRELFPAARAYPHLLSALLLKSGGVALVERRALGATAIERFLAAKPPPLSADVVAETDMRKDSEGRTVLQTTLRGQGADGFAPAVCEHVTADIVQQQADAILAALRCKPAGRADPDRLKQEAAQLFVRAYLLAREEHSEEAYELAESALILNPLLRNARRLGERMFAKLLCASIGRWDRLDATARDVVHDEARQYVSDYHDRAVAWFRENQPYLVGSVEALGFGDLEGGYELGAEWLEFTSPALCTFWPDVAALHRQKRLTFVKGYKDLMEETGDARLLHRPSIWSYIGPDCLYEYLQGIEDAAAFMETAKTYFQYETGTFPWRGNIARYVKGYSSRALRTPQAIVARYKSDKAADWSQLGEFCQWLAGQNDPLALLWRMTIVDGLGETSPASFRGSLDRKAVQEQIRISAIRVADALTRDGCLDRQYAEKTELLAGRARPLWASAGPDALLACWDAAKTCRPETAAATAVIILDALKAAKQTDPAARVSADALTIVQPGQNGYDAITAYHRWTDIEQGRARDTRIWRKATCLFSGTPDGNDHGRNWTAASDDGKRLYLRDTRSSTAYVLDAEDGKTRRYEYGSLGLASAGDSRPTPGTRQTAAVLCAGKMWFTAGEKGIVAVDLETGRPLLYDSRSGLYSDQVRLLTAVRGKVYGVAYGPYTPSSSWWSYGRSRPFVIFELDPKTGRVRNLDGSGTEIGRLAGSNSVVIRDIMGDEQRNGIWVMEEWSSLQFPHFYDLQSEQWIRIRINAFQWQMDDRSVGLNPHPRGVLFGPYLYEPERDALSFLPRFDTAENPAPGGAVEIDLHPPVAEWRGEVWGVSSDGRLTRVSSDGRRTEYGEAFLPPGYAIYQLLPIGQSLAVVAFDQGASNTQVWRIDAAESEAAKTSQPAASPSPVQVRSDAEREAPSPGGQTVPIAKPGLADLRAVVAPETPQTRLLAEGSEYAFALQLAAGKATGLPLEVENSAGIRFRLVPPGKFTMGNERAAGSYTSWRGAILRPVTFTKPIYVSKHEITQGQWEKVMGTNPMRFGVKQPDLPMEEVSWGMCRDFLAKLGQSENVPPQTYRFLTEAEWEYASRAGTDTHFCFGDRLDRSLANVMSPDGEYPFVLAPRLPTAPAPLPVGSYPPNAWGLYDMHGSVSEWCQDLYAWRYPADPAVDPVQEGEGWKRVWRGGNRFNDSGDCSAFFCDFARVPPDTPARGFGFRIVRQLPTL